MGANYHPKGLPLSWLSSIVDLVGGKATESIDVKHHVAQTSLISYLQ